MFRPREPGSSTPRWAAAASSGIGAGVLCYWALQLVAKLRIDDSLAVFGVHGIGGIWGALATGLFFGIGTAGVYSLDRSVIDQFGRQAVAVGATIGWSFAWTLAIFWVLKVTIGVRVKEEEEEVGLDQSQHGEAAYEALG